MDSFAAHLKAWLTPLNAALFAVGLLCFTAIALWAPPDVREWLFGANGLVAFIVGLALRSPIDRARAVLAADSTAPVDPAKPEEETKP